MIDFDCNVSTYSSGRTAIQAFLSIKGKMDAAKKQFFQGINHLDEMDDNLFICGTCGNWLTGQITKDTNGKNVCQSCTSEKGGKRDKSSEAFLKLFLYPCPHDDCSFIGKNNTILAHAQRCEYAPNDCYLCNEPKMDLMAYKAHIKRMHADAILKIDTPLLKFSMKQFIEGKFIVIYKNHLFLLYMKLIDGKIAVNVAKPFHRSQEDFSKIFTVSFKCERSYQELTKSMVSCSQVLGNDNTSDITIINPTEIKIFFSNFNKTIQLGECPICEHDMDVQLCQCSNGHNVCNECGKMITSCAICRDNSLKSVNLQYLFPTFAKICENAEHGCLFIGENDERKKHIKKCLYNVLRCNICKANVCKLNVTSHMKNVHKMFKNAEPLSSIVPCDVFSVQYYCSYNNELFKINGNTVGPVTEQERRCGFSVKMEYNRDVSEAKKYSFEIQILDKDYNAKVVHFLRGICQTSDDNNFVVFINFEVWKNYMAEKDGERKVYYRCIITKTD